MTSKPYCGNCGRKGNARTLMACCVTPEGDTLHICRDKKACMERLDRNLDRTFGKKGRKS